MDIADGADQAALVGLAKILDRDNAFGGARERIAPKPHRHRAGMTGHAGQVRCKASGTRDHGHDADGKILRLKHRSLLDVKLDIGQ